MTSYRDQSQVFIIVRVPQRPKIALKKIGMSKFGSFYIIRINKMPQFLSRLSPEEPSIGNTYNVLDYANLDFKVIS